MATPVWRQIIEGTYDPFSSSFSPSRSSGGMGGLETDWRVFSEEQDAARAAERLREADERAALEERGDEYVNLQQAQGRLERAIGTAEALGQPEAEPAELPTALEGIARVLDTAKSTVVGGLSGLLGWDIEGEGDRDATKTLGGRFRRIEDRIGDRSRIQAAWDRAMNALFYDRSYGFGDFGPLRYEADETSRAARTALGTVAFVLDTAFDPLTYMSFGSSIVGRLTASTGVRVATRNAGKEALKAGGETVMRREAAKLSRGELVARVGATTGEDAAELAIRNNDQLVDTLFRSSKELFEEAALDGWSMGNAAAYGARGRTGLYDRLVGTVGRDEANKIFRALPGDLAGGLRIRVPFKRTLSEETGLRLPTIYRFPFSQPGRGFDRLGMGTVTRKMNEVRLWARTNPARFIEHVTGKYGEDWTKVLNAARAGDAEAVEAYSSHFAMMTTDKAYRIFGQQFDQEVAATMYRIGKMRGLPEVTDAKEIDDWMAEAYFKRGRDDIPEILTPNHVIAADMTHQLWQLTDKVQKIATELYGPEYAAKMDEYATRMLTDDGFKEIEQRLGYMRKKGVRLGEGATGRDYTSFPKKIDVDDNGNMVVTEWYTPAEIQKMTGRDVFVSDPIEAVGLYLEMMQRQLKRDWALKALKDAGILLPVGRDVIEKPTFGRISSEASRRLVKLRNIISKIEKGEAIPESDAARLSAYQAGQEQLRSLGQMVEVEPGVFRSKDGVVELRQSSRGDWLAYVNGQLIERPPKPSQRNLELEQPGPPRAVEEGTEAAATAPPEIPRVKFDEKRFGYYDADGNRVPESYIRPSQPGIPGISGEAGLRAYMNLPEFRPWLSNPTDENLQYVHKILRARLYAHKLEPGLDSQTYNNYVEQIVNLEQEFPWLRNMDYGEIAPKFVPPPPKGAAPVIPKQIFNEDGELLPNPAYLASLEEAAAAPPAPRAGVPSSVDEIKFIRQPGGQYEAVLPDGSTVTIVKRRDPNNPGLAARWYTELDGNVIGSHPKLADAQRAVKDRAADVAPVAPRSIGDTELLPGLRTEQEILEELEGAPLSWSKSGRNTVAKYKDFEIVISPAKKKPGSMTKYQIEVVAPDGVRSLDTSHVNLEYTKGLVSEFHLRPAIRNYELRVRERAVREAIGDSGEWPGLSLVEDSFQQYGSYAKHTTLTEVDFGDGSSLILSWNGRSWVSSRLIHGNYIGEQPVAFANDNWDEFSEALDEVYPGIKRILDEQLPGRPVENPDGTISFAEGPAPARVDRGVGEPKAGQSVRDYEYETGSARAEEQMSFSVDDFGAEGGIIIQAAVQGETRLFTGKLRRVGRSAYQLSVQENGRTIRTAFLEGNKQKAIENSQLQIRAAYADLYMEEAIAARYGVEQIGPRAFVAEDLDDLLDTGFYDIRAVPGGEGEYRFAMKADGTIDVDYDRLSNGGWEGIADNVATLEEARDIAMRHSSDLFGPMPDAPVSGVSTVPRAARPDSEIPEAAAPEAPRRKARLGPEENPQGVPPSSASVNTAFKGVIPDPDETFEPFGIGTRARRASWFYEGTQYVIERAERSAIRPQPGAAGRIQYDTYTIYRVNPGQRRQVVTSGVSYDEAVNATLRDSNDLFSTKYPNLRSQALKLPPPEKIGARMVSAGNYEYTLPDGTILKVSRVRREITKGKEIWAVTDSSGNVIGRFRTKDDAINALSGKPVRPIFEHPEGARMANIARESIRKIEEADKAVRAITADALAGKDVASGTLDSIGIELENAINALRNALEILSFDDPDTARRIVNEINGRPDVQKVMADTVEGVSDLRPEVPSRGVQTTLDQGPEDMPQLGFRDRYEAEFYANRFANAQREPAARMVNDEIWETNRQALIDKLRQDEKWLEAAFDFSFWTRMPGEAIDTWVDRVGSFLRRIEQETGGKPIDPMREVFDRTRYAQALADAGYGPLRPGDGIRMNDSVARIIQDENLYGPEMLADSIRRHFRAAKDVDGPEKFFRNFWRPYYTASKAWMTQGRGYGYTVRNIIGSMYNSWLLDVGARHFRESAALLAARVGAKEDADAVILRVGATEKKGAVEVWEDAFYKSLERRLATGNIKMNKNSVKRLVSAYKSFQENNYGGRSARSRTQGEILDRGNYGMTVYGSKELGRTPADLFPGKTVEELTRPQRILNASIDNAWMRHVTRLNEGIEDYLRFAAFLRGIDIYGLSDGGLAAGTIVRGTQFDYADLSDFERNVLKNIIPFYTWTRYNVPLQVRSVWMEPGKVARLLRFHEEVVQAWTGKAEEEGESLPEWLRRRGGWMTTFTTPSSDPDSVLGQIFGQKEDPIAAFIESPLSDLGMLFNATLNPLQMMNSDEIINNLNPLIGRLPYELFTGQSYATGRELRDDAEAPRWAIALGLARKDDEGVWRYNERVGQAVRNIIPPAAQAERLFAPVVGDPRQRRRWLTSLGSNIIANPMYTVDPNQQAYAISQYAQGISDALEEGIIDYEDKRDIIYRLLDRGVEPEDIARLGLGSPREIEIESYNFDELDRTRRIQQTDDELSTFFETLPPSVAEDFIFRRGYRGRRGAEAVEAWRSREALDVLNALDLPKVDVAFGQWFRTLSFGEQQQHVFRYGFGPYRGAEAVQRWIVQGGLPNIPPGMGSADFVG